MRMKSSRASSGKKPVNLSVNAALLTEAKAFGINLSKLTEDALTVAVKAEKERRWLEENKEAIEYYNAWVEKNGLLIEPIWMTEDGPF